MEAKDLRIGNWFLGDCTEGKFHQITANEILDFYDDPLDDYYQPIPLTEEWLLKLGFEYNDNYENYRVKANEYYNSVKLDDGIWCYNNDNSDAGCYFVTEIKHVHQLQNLYFALTGQELTLKNFSWTISHY
jgi:hypothetical protein